MIGLLCARRWEKRNRSCLLYKLGVLNHFNLQDIFWPKVLKYFHKNCQILIKIFKSICFNLVPIYVDLDILIITGQILCLKCFNISGQNMFPVGKLFQYPQSVYSLPFCLWKKRTENIFLVLTMNYHKILQQNKLCPPKQQ